MRPGPQACQESKRKLHNQVAQTPWNLLLLLLHLSFSYTCDLMASIPYDLLSEKDGAWAHFPKRSACYAGTSQKWMTAALQPTLGVALKMLMKENPPRRQSIWLFTLLGLRWPDDRIHSVL